MLGHASSWHDTEAQDWCNASSSRSGDQVETRNAHQRPLPTGCLFVSHCSVRGILLCVFDELREEGGKRVTKCEPGEFPPSLPARDLHRIARDFSVAQSIQSPAGRGVRKEAVSVTVLCSPACK